MINVKEQIDLLGMKAEDKVTGFKGIVTSISFDLYGCIQAIINPGTDKDGKLQEQCWFDVARLNVIGKEPVMYPPDFSYEEYNLHGPAEKPAFTKS